VLLLDFNDTGVPYRIQGGADQLARGSGAGRDTTLVSEFAHGFATLGTIGFEGRFDCAAIGTVANVASRLCDEAKPVES